jgi:CBS domain-containing protein
MKVREIMTPEPFCCIGFESVQNVARVMKEWDVGALPVVADPRSLRVRGIVTDRDLCTALARGADPAKTPVEQVMTSDPATCQMEDDVESCAEIMRERQVRRVPVVDEHGHCIGIVAQADLALRGKLRDVVETVVEISKPTH